MAYMKMLNIDLTVFCTFINGDLGMYRMPGMM